MVIFDLATSHELVDKDDFSVDTTFIVLVFLSTIPNAYKCALSHRTIAGSFIINTPY